MPATTLSQLTSLLGTYVEPSGDFRASLNQVLARIYNMGTYRDLTVQYSLPVTDGCITLPDDADAILHTMVDGYPVPVRALWHDFKSAGFGNGNVGPSWGLIDSGFTPTMISIPENTVTLHVVPAAVSTTGGTHSLADGEVITIKGSNGDQFYNATDNGATQTFSPSVDSVVSIHFESLTDAYDIRLTANNPDTTIATVGPDSGVTRYRRFRVNGATDGQTVVHVLCKRAFKPLLNPTDISFIGNINAIKQGLLGRLAEDNADIERSEYHWNKCMLLIEEEAASTRGAAIPRLNVDPYGIGNAGRIQNSY